MLRAGDCHRGSSGILRIDQVVTILKDLISIPSINPMGRDDTPADLTGESRVSDYIEDFIGKTKLDLITQETDIPGARNVGGMLFRSQSAKTIVLQSHMDTVGINGDRNLLTPIERDGHIFGRGACDDKGSLAAMLTALSIAAKNSSAIENNVIVMGVTDEEYSWRGSAALVSQEPTRSADFGLVGEPTGCRLVNGYKGIARWSIETSGVSCHSSQPGDGVNAIYRMARILSLIEEYQRKLDQVIDEDLGSESISVGTINGGTAVNIVPDRCAIEIDRRLTRRTSPNQARTAVGDYLRMHGVDFDFTMSPLKDAANAVLLDENSQWIKYLISISGRLGLDAKTCVVGFGSDAYRMNDAGIQTVIWGPGDISTAHSPSESVSIRELENAVEFYLAIMQGSAI